MTHEDPTLKVRFMLTANGSHLGRDCRTVADAIAASRDDLEVLDAKWGRKPSDWRETGGGWGRQQLTDYERGYIDAVVRRTDQTGLVARRLIDIIERLSK